MSSAVGQQTTAVAAADYMAAADSSAAGNSDCFHKVTAGDFLPAGNNHLVADYMAGNSLAVAGSLLVAVRMVAVYPVEGAAAEKIHIPARIHSDTAQDFVLGNS